MKDEVNWMDFMSLTNKNHEPVVGKQGKKILI